MSDDVCTCIICDECDGTGTVWVSFDGDYLGNHRADDLDELEMCEKCGGRGIIEICLRCFELEQKYE